MKENITNEASKPASEINRKFRVFSPEQRIVSQWQVIKNLSVICLAFVLLFTAYNGLSMLQSTMNQKQGIGVASQAIIYAAFCISALLFPKYTIQKIGCKRTLLVSMSCYIPYIAANFYFNWTTMVPTAILIGLAGSLLWSAESTYLNESSTIYTILAMKENYIEDQCLKTNIPKSNCNLTKYEKTDLSTANEQENYMKFEPLNVKELRKDSDSIICHYTPNLDFNSPKNSNKDDISEDIFKIDKCALDRASSSNLRSLEDRKDIGNSEPSMSKEYSKMVSSVTARFFGLFGMIYRTTDIWSNLMSYYVLHDNSILDNMTESSNCSCGASFCNVESNCFERNLAEPSQYMRNILTGVSVLISVIAVLLVFFFLDELGMDKQPVKFSFNFAMATCKFFRKKEAVLLLPLSAYMGFQQAFYIGDFTKSYIACSWGVYHIGLVTVCYGLTGGISCTSSGLLVKYLGRIPVMLFGALINDATCIFLLVWTPLLGQPTQLFVAAAMWGISGGILWSQLMAFYGVIFKEDEEAAFAGYHLCLSIGYCVVFSYSSYICTYIKLYILLAVSTMGIIGYLKTELIQMQLKKEIKLNETGG